MQPYPYLPGICERSKLVVLVSTGGQGIQGMWAGFAPAGEFPGSETSLKEGEITEELIYWMYWS